ncbi:DUF6073 family protein [Allocoleopsis sp.]|uniref:DUF6073 family protein n=1 Tax=Allocoleopsis sp. TaxID=3088169 RepID=UPI002FD11626
MNGEEFGRGLREILIGVLGVERGTPVSSEGGVKPLPERPQGQLPTGQPEQLPVGRPGSRVVTNPEVKPRTLPEAGTDTVDITIEETYEVEGIGRDTVILKGILTTERATPLLSFGTTEQSWDNSAVVAKFTSLALKGESDVFGPIQVKLDQSTSGFGMVQGGNCRAVMPIEVSMPAHNITLRSATPVQLQSKVSHVPPIGDENTESVSPVVLVDTSTGKSRGQILKARVAWRELAAQSFDAIGVAE